MEEQAKKPSENSQCLNCQHYNEEYPDHCIAFHPDPTPGDILTGRATHEKPIDGQTHPDIIFMPTDESLIPSL